VDTEKLKTIHTTPAAPARWTSSSPATVDQHNDWRSTSDWALWTPGDVDEEERFNIVASTS
jgi:hypothetical protein